MQVSPTGMFANMRYKRGETILFLNGPIFSTYAPGSLYIGKNQYIIDPFVKTLKSSTTESNAVITDAEIVASIDIEVGDEIKIELLQNC